MTASSRKGIIAAAGGSLPRQRTLPRRISGINFSSLRSFFILRGTVDRSEDYAKK
jgi:hypothetical protein